MQVSDCTVENDYIIHPVGFRKCTPKWLQWIARPQAVLALLSILTITQGFIVNGVNNVNTTSYERRYRLPSTKTGFISSAYDVSVGVSAIFVGYFGGQAHKPRLLGLAAVTMALGSLTMALPHFVSGKYEPGCARSDRCLANETVDNFGSRHCQSNENDSSALQNYFYVLILGQILHGIGGSCLFTIGLALVDDSVSAHSSPMYLGVLWSLTSLGSPTGYILGGYFLRFYVDVEMTPLDGVTVADPRWVGAWWIGFLISSTLFLSTVLPFFALPKTLRGASKTVVVKVLPETGSEQNPPAFANARALPTALLALLRNKPYVLISLAAASDGLYVTGFATFLPKILQSQFHLNASGAALYSGVMLLCVSATHLLSGLVCRRLNVRVQGALRLAIICSVIYIASMPILFIKCDKSFLKSRDQLDGFCNNNCGCDTYAYKPVCGSDGVEYFSPCFAGCRTFELAHSGRNTMFTNCSCVNSSMNDATLGRCPSDCNKFAIFYPIFVLTTCIFFIPVVATNGATMRCLPETLKSFGLGVQSSSARFLGTIPGPMVFGRVIDSACTLWQTLDNGATGSCWTYDSDSLALYLFIVAATTKAVTTVCLSLAHYTLPKASPKAVSDTTDEAAASPT